jgi:two-component system, OmpR family, phosphate regulon response regulator PhoB
MISRTAIRPPLKAKILVAQNDANSAGQLKLSLGDEGYEVVSATDGEEAMKQIPLQLPSLIVLDLMLPTRSGFELCRQIRSDKAFSHLAILAVTSRAEEAEIAFELGADDHVIKPFTGLELSLRIRRLLRARHFAPPEADEDEIAVKNLRLDVPRHKATVEGKRLDLTFTEFKLLKVLAQRRGRVQTRERLLQDVWDYNCYLDTRTVDTHVLRLRRKLGAARSYLESVRGVGYRFAET